MTEHIDQQNLLEYRAGLLDDSPDDIENIELHLQNCDECRSVWQDLDAQFKQIALTINEVDDSTLSIQLAERRRAALTGNTWQDFKWRHASIAVAVLLTMSVGLVFTLLNQQNPSKQANPGVTQATEDNL